MGIKKGKLGQPVAEPTYAAAKKGSAADRDLADLEQKAYDGMSSDDDDGLTREERKKLHRKAAKAGRHARSMWEGSAGWHALTASAPHVQRASMPQPRAPPPRSTLQACLEATFIFRGAPACKLHHPSAPSRPGP